MTTMSELADKAKKETPRWSINKIYARPRYLAMHREHKLEDLKTLEFFLKGNEKPHTGYERDGKILRMIPERKEYLKAEIKRIKAELKTINKILGAV